MRTLRGRSFQVRPNGREKRRAFVTLRVTKARPARKLPSGSASVPTPFGGPGPPTSLAVGTMTTIAHHADYLCAAASRLGSESAFEVLARAKALEATARSVVHMEIGEPDFDTPDHIKRAGIRAIEENYSHYTPSAGIPELREAIAAYAGSFRGLAQPFSAANVVGGAGAKPIIWNLLSALLDPGDELIYADPAYPAYASAASYLEAKPV